MAKADTEQTITLTGVVKTLGPGILFAGAAIGGSHLVWSTRAGAIYGFGLLWLVLLVNIFKYPFFEFAHRYTAATGESLLAGYRRVGRWTLWCFFVFAVVSSIMNVAGVTAITAVLAGKLFHADLSPLWWSERIIFACMLILVIGHYAMLDRVMKVIMVVLALSTVAAFGMAAAHGGNAQPGVQAPPLWNALGLAFLIKLMGWMPGPVDISVWPTLWAAERRKQTGHTPTMREALVDFHIGYIGTAVLAVCFLGLGALVMFGTGEDFGQTGLQFANTLLGLYTDTLGHWSFYVVATSAFTCMLSTSLTCVDAYTRTLHASILLGFSMPDRRAQREDPIYWLCMVFVAGSALLIIGFFMDKILTLIGIATMMAFISAPVLAYLNYRVITDEHVPAECRPPKWLHVLSWAGMAFLALFTVLYVGHLYYESGQ